MTQINFKTVTDLQTHYLVTSVWHIRHSVALQLPVAGSLEVSTHCSCQEHQRLTGVVKMPGHGSCS